MANDILNFFKPPYYCYNDVNGNKDLASQAVKAANNFFKTSWRFSRSEVTGYPEINAVKSTTVNGRYPVF